ncbi:MAG: DUF192 domain-containing protein [Candidatus Melainabacteria bacterium]|nr:DUF192 domain-containing protein [Candidatus Melainabacteria bacterium]
MGVSKAVKSFYNLTRGTSLAANATVANTFWRRLAGLVTRTQLKPGEGLVLEPCQCIHMFFMSYAIDAVFLDSKNHVAGTVENIMPWQVSGFYANARSCLELPAGTISQTLTRVGDIIKVTDEFTLPKT